MKRAVFNVTVAGTNISTALLPMLIDLSVTDNKGTHSDTASLTLDDRAGQIMLPQHGAAVSISLGWEGEGIREVFAGTVDEFRSSGSKSGGRVLTISAKGVNTLGKAKEGQNRHFDNKTVEEVIRETGSHAGVTEIEVDPSLASIKLPYIDLREESFIHFGERIAAKIGGAFRVRGTKATIVKRGAEYAATVTAQEGVNLIAWDVAPIIGRGKYKAARSRAYDQKAAREVVVEEPVATDDDAAEATITSRDLLADEDEATLSAKANADGSLETSGGGSVDIDGTTDAVPGGSCVLIGARPGIDGTYTIQSVGHNFSRSGGWTTSLTLGHPKGEAGKDKRDKKGKAATAPGTDTDYNKVIDDMSGGGT